MPTESLSQAIERLVARGFDHDLRAEDGALRDVATGILHDPQLLMIEEAVRFEGESDPDEQAILFALRSHTGSAIGTYVVVYGPAMPADDATVVWKLGSRG